jgi:predicted short-subunit dehydrogenase-like oxidoreductase (DUF2520 family)
MPPTSLIRARTRLAIVGPGRLGTTLAHALGAADVFEVIGPLGRGADCTDCAGVLLCVPDAEIARAAAAITPGPLVGHCSGATGLEPLAPHEAFSLHPLMTVTAAGSVGECEQLSGNLFEDATAAIDGTSTRALGMAESVAHALRMRVVQIEPADRAAYHAAASIASNFLVTLEAAAERLGATAGLERRMLVPLVQATVENWASLGGERALTGPLARGDEATVARQRAAVAERTPDLLPLFDALTQATRALAAGRELEHV